MNANSKIRRRLETFERMWPVISASTLGSTFQWFDFYLYTILSVTVFPAVFFPSLDHLAGTIASFGTSFGGFVARPLGATFFGWFGDRIGRRSTLVSTLMLIGIATMFMGILPGYGRLGIVAPILLTVLRFLQGFGVGGEWGGATLLTLEYSDDRNRAFWTSWPQSSVSIGLGCATLATLLFSNLYPGLAYESIGWRIPFLFSPILLMVSFYIRLRIPETPLFALVQKEKRESKAPLLDVLRYHWRDVLLSVLLRSGDQAPFYLFTTFILSYGVADLNLPIELLYVGISVGSLIEVLLFPVVGYIADRLGHKFCYSVACVVMACIAFPYFWLLNTRNPGLVFLAIILSFDVAHVLIYAPQASLIAERFGTRVRYTGASLGFQLSSITAGGPAPLIATYLLRQNIGTPVIPSYTLIAAFIIAASLISLLAVLPLKEYTGKALAKDIP